MTAPSYPLDYSGVSPANKITDEIQTVTRLNNHNFYLLIPVAAPFFLDNLVVKYLNSTTGQYTPLVFGVDYYPCLPFVGATRSIGKPVYGAITINNPNLNGTIKVTYQTLGGPWTLDEGFVMEQVLEKNLNPRVVSWEQITDLPNVYPPTPHSWDLVDLVGEAEVLAKLADIEVAILTPPAPNYTRPDWNATDPLSPSFIRNKPEIVTTIDLSQLSDERDKKDWSYTLPGIDFLKQIQPGYFTWDARDGSKPNKRSAGFSAQKLKATQEAFNAQALDLVDETNPNKLLAKYQHLLPVIVNSLIELDNHYKKEIENLKEQISKLQN